MDLSGYKLEGSEDYLEFKFHSIGPKGVIIKKIIFTKDEDIQPGAYNLAFGDWNEAEQKIDDLIITDNQDIDKIFSTIAAAVKDFNKHYPGTAIYAIGSTPARTRLYQMKINKYLSEIKVDFEIFGEIDNEQLMPFRPGIKYLSFIAVPKS